MFPAIFAVVLLGHFVAAEIYVGQNPQNVNAVIKDENGNLIPVTGVADEIVVVDLNYGGEEKSSGMSVDISVTPVNISSNGSTGYPPSTYPSSISMPSGSLPMQVSNPPLVASPFTLPSAAPPATWNFSSFAGPSQPSISSLGLANSKFGVGPSTSGAGIFPSNSGLGVGLNIPPFSSIGTNSIGAPPVIHPPATGLPSQSPVSEYDNLVSDLSEPSSTKTGVPSPVSKSNTYYYPSASHPHIINVRSTQYNEYPQNSAPTSFATQNFINSYPSAFPSTGYFSNPSLFINGYPTSIGQTSFPYPPNTWASGYVNPSLSGWPVPGSEVVSSPALNFDFPTPASAPWPSALSDYNSGPGGNYPETYIPPPSPPLIEPPLYPVAVNYPETYFPPPLPPLSEPSISPAVAENIVGGLIPASVIIPVFPQNGEETFNYTIAGNGTILNTIMPTLNTPQTPFYPPTFVTSTPISSSSSSKHSSPPTQVTPTISNPFTFYNPFTTPQTPTPFTLPHTYPTPQSTNSPIPITSPTFPNYPTSSGYTTGSGSGNGSGISGTGSGSKAPHNQLTTPQVIITSIETTTHKTTPTTKETTKPFSFFNPFTFPTTPKPKTTTTSSASGTATGYAPSSTGSENSGPFTTFNPFTFPTTHKPETTTKKNHHGEGSSTIKPVTTAFGGTLPGTGSGSGSGIGTATGSGLSGTGSGPSNPFTFPTHTPKTTTKKNHHGEGSSTIKPVTTAFGGTLTGTGSGSDSGIGTATGSGLSGTGSGPSNPFTFPTHTPKTTTKKNHHGEGSSTTKPVTTAFGGTLSETGSGSGFGTGTGTGSESSSPFSIFNPFIFFTTPKPKTTTEKNQDGIGSSTNKPVTTAFGGTVSGTGSGSGFGTSTGTGSESSGPFTIFNPFTFSTTHGPKTTLKNPHKGNGFDVSQPATTATGGSATATGTGFSTGFSTSSNPFNFNPFTFPTTHTTKTTTKKPNHEQSNPFDFFSHSTTQKPVTTAFGGTATGTGSESTKKPHNENFNPFNLFNFFIPSFTRKPSTTAFGGSKTSKKSNPLFNLFTLPTTTRSHSNLSALSSAGDNGLGTGLSFETGTGSAPETGSKKSSNPFGGFNFFGNSKSNTATARSSKSNDNSNSLFDFFNPLRNTKSQSTSKQNFSNPFSQSKSNGSKNKKSNPPNFFNLFGGRGQKNTQKNNGFAAPSMFVELGGSLGPVVDPVTLTPVNPSDSFVSNVTPSTTHHKNKKNNPFFNMTNMMMNLSNPFQFPPNTNATPLNGILGTLFNSSTIKMQPVNESFPGLSGIINLFLNNGQSMLNPGNSNASPFNSFLNSVMSTSALFPPFGGSSSSSFTDLLNSFANSSAFNLSSTSSSFDDMMNSFFQNNPWLFNETDGSLSPLTDMMNSIMNTTSSLFNMSNETSTPPSSGSSDGNGFQNSISNLMNPFLGGRSSIFNSTSPSLMSGNSKNLKSMIQNFLPPSMLGGNDDKEYNTDYPEDEIYKDLNSSDGDDEDYFNPLPGLLPPTNDEFGVNGTTPPSTNPFSVGGLLNPATFMNGSSFNLTSAAANFKLFSNLQKIITSLNNTGLFGDLSGLSQLTQNLSSIVTQAMNHSTRDPYNLDQIISIIISMWQNIIPILQKFMSNIAPQTPTLRHGQSLPLIPFPPANHRPIPRGHGTSFLVVPSSQSEPMMSHPLLPTNDGMQASAPASEPKSEATPESKPETTPESKPEPIPEPAPVDSSLPVPVPPQTSTSPKPTTIQNSSAGSGTPASTPPTNTNGTSTSPNAGINLSSTWITLISCLFVALSQKNFLALL